MLDNLDWILYLKVFDLVYAFPWEFDHMKLLLLKVMYVQGRLIVWNKLLLCL